MPDGGSPAGSVQNDLPILLVGEVEPLADDRRVILEHPGAEGAARAAPSGPARRRFFQLASSIKAVQSRAHRNP
jgi:hypothetical protein